MSLSLILLLQVVGIFAAGCHADRASGSGQLLQLSVIKDPLDLQPQPPRQEFDFKDRTAYSLHACNKERSLTQEKGELVEYSRPERCSSHIHGIHGSCFKERDDHPSESSVRQHEKPQPCSPATVSVNCEKSATLDSTIQKEYNKQIIEIVEHRKGQQKQLELDRGAVSTNGKDKKQQWATSPAAPVTPSVPSSPTATGGLHGDSICNSIITSSVLRYSGSMIGSLGIRRRKTVEDGAVSGSISSICDSKTSSSQRLKSAVAVPAGGGAKAGGKAGQTRFSSKVRDAIFPVYGSQEVRKFLSLGMVKFFIIFVLTLTRDLKDTLIVTTCGAEAISFLKVYGVLPAATIFTVYYSYISSKLSRRALFYVTAVPFFIFYVLFNGLIYPNLHILHPANFGSDSNALPQGLSYVVSLWRHWSFALFYVISELYSSVSVGVLFWQFANDIIPVDQAKRFYPLFGQMSSLAPILAGQCVMRFATSSTFDVTLRVITTLVTLSGVALCCFYEICTRIAASEGRAGYLRGAALKEAEEAKKVREEGKGTAVKGKKPKMGLSESFRILSKSRYLRLLSVLVLSYGLSINLTEIMWKSILRLQYPDAVDFQRFMAGYSSIVGCVTFMVIFAGSNIIKHLGWGVGALMTPLMMAVMALPVFAIAITGDFSSTGPNSGGGKAASSVLKFAVLIGAAQSILSKATKYALFDPTTQMAYIPLDDDSKVKGKAAIDGLGSRVGKSGGSLLQQGLVLMFGNVLKAAPAVAVIFYSMLTAWVICAQKLAVLFREAISSSSSSSS